jgi:hypothetical protein
MPPRKQPELLEVDPDTGRILDDEENIERENLQADQDRAVDEIIGEFEASDDNVTYRASINKVPDGYKKGGKEEWCFDVDSAEIHGMKTRLRDEYGAGIYRIRVFKKSKQIRQFDYHIAKPSITRPIANNDNPALNAMAEQIRSLSENQNKLMERLLNNSQQPTNQGDDIDRLVKLSTVMKNMQPPQIEHAGNGGMSMKDGMELFTKGMELAGDMRGENPDNWLSVFKEILKGLPVAEIMSNLSRLQQSRQPQLNAPNQPQRQPQMQVPPNPQNPNNSPAQTGAQLEANMKYLIQKAMNNSDPSLYAEWLLDNADQTLIRQMANDPNVLGQLSVVFPRLNEPNIRAWFVELVENVRTMLAEWDNQVQNGAGIGQPDTMRGNDAGASISDHDSTGRNSGDQNNPEVNAEIGETGEEEFPN